MRECVNRRGKAGLVSLLVKWMVPVLALEIHGSSEDSAVDGDRAGQTRGLEGEGNRSRRSYSAVGCDNVMVLWATVLRRVG